LHYDNSGSDTDEGVEIAGPAALNLSGWSLFAYDGSSGSSYDTVSLAGVLPNLQNGYGTLWFSFAELQNGAPDGLALVDPSGAVVQLLSYEGSFTPTTGPAAGLAAEDIGVSEPPPTSEGFSLQLAGTGTTYADFVWEVPASQTHDLINNNQSFLMQGPTPTATQSPTPTQSPTATASPTQTPLPSPTPTATPTSTPNPSPTDGGPITGVEGWVFY
jgi:hypothetical protein